MLKVQSISDKIPLGCLAWVNFGCALLCNPLRSHSFGPSQSYFSLLVSVNRQTFFFAEALAHPLLADIRDKSLETTSPELVVPLDRTLRKGLSQNRLPRLPHKTSLNLIKRKRVEHGLNQKCFLDHFGVSLMYCKYLQYVKVFHFWTRSPIEMIDIRQFLSRFLLFPRQASFRKGT